MRNFATIILKVDAFWQRVGRTLAIIGSAVLIFATFLVVADVSGRYLFLHPIPGAVESMAIYLPYITFFSMAYALGLGRHVRVTLLFGRLPPKLRLSADSLACVLGIFFLSVLIYYSWRQFWYSAAVNEALTAQIYLPAWVGKFAMPVGLFAFLIQYLLRLLGNLGYLTGKIKVAENVTEQIAVD
ncbi:TRAP transporter small permease subunit [Chloroflexota bacterium]